MRPRCSHRPTRPPEVWDQAPIFWIIWYMAGGAKCYTQRDYIVRLLRPEKRDLVLAIMAIVSV
jgi:hypothetical protein